MAANETPSSGFPVVLVLRDGTQVPLQADASTVYIARRLAAEALVEDPDRIDYAEVRWIAAGRVERITHEKAQQHLPGEY